MLAELERLRPAEIITPSEATGLQGLLKGSFPILNGHDDWVFAPETAVFTVREHLQGGVAGRFRLEEQAGGHRRGGGGAALSDAASAPGRGAFDVAVVLRDVGFPGAGQITTLRHLEILEPLHRDAARTATLCTGALNRTVTPMGARGGCGTGCHNRWQTRGRSRGVRRRCGPGWRSGGVLEKFRAQLAQQVRDLERTIEGA